MPQQSTTQIQRFKPPKGYYLKRRMAYSIGKANHWQYLSYTKDTSKRGKQKDSIKGYIWLETQERQDNTVIFKSIYEAFEMASRYQEIEGLRKHSYEPEEIV